MSDTPPSAVTVPVEISGEEAKGVSSEETPGEFCVLPDATRRVRLASLEQWLDLCA
jgi:hypothetical protein